VQGSAVEKLQRTVVESVKVMVNLVMGFAMTTTLAGSVMGMDPRAAAKGRCVAFVMKAQVAMEFVADPKKMFVAYVEVMVLPVVDVSSQMLATFAVTVLFQTIQLVSCQSKERIASEGAPRTIVKVRVGEQLQRILVGCAVEVEKHAVTLLLAIVQLVSIAVASVEETPRETCVASVVGVGTRALVVPTLQLVILM
jgi:hypothetical protein